MLLCGCSRFPFPLETCMYYLLLIIRAVSILLFFGVAQTFKRRFCSSICYFLAFLLPIMLRFWGSNMLQRGYYAREICYLWLFALPLSPFPLATCVYYSLFISGLFFILALAGDIAFFFYRVHNVVFNSCMYACIACMYVKFTFMCIPYRDIYHTLSGMVRSINTQAPIRVRSDGTTIRYYPPDSVLYCLVWLCLEALHGD